MKRALVIALLLVACGGSTSPRSRIERTRIIAARAHPRSDATRAWLLPGESGVVEYLVVGPSGPTVALGTSFLACMRASAAGLDGIAGCDGPTFDAFDEAIAPAIGPSLTRAFDVPADLGVDPSSAWLTYLGTCVGSGESSIDPTTKRASCTDGARSELYELDVRIVADVQSANHHPNLHDERFFVGDALWTDPDPSVLAAGCASIAASSSLPTVRLSGFDPTLVFGCSADDRESYAAFDADLRPIVAREHLDIAHYVTLGRIENATRIDDDVVGNLVSSVWTRPVLASDHARDADLVLDDAQRADLSSGLLVRFWFVARDGRGGSDWVERDLCLVP